MDRRLAVYSAVLVPRGPVGKLDGKILGCRELVLLHDARGHPLLATTHRGDQHLTIGLPHLLHCHEQAIDQMGVQRVVIDREGMAAEFLAQQKLAGRQVVTLLRSDQYESERSFDEVGEWQPWLYWLLGSSVQKLALQEGERSSSPTCKHRRVGVESDVVDSILMLEQRHFHVMEKIFYGRCFHHSPVAEG
jgi:hypothetical protein